MLHHYRLITTAELQEFLCHQYKNEVFKAVKANIPEPFVASLLQRLLNCAAFLSKLQENFSTFYNQRAKHGRQWLW
jgi:hypothetical protein